MLIVGTNGFLPQRRGDEGEGMRDEGGEVTGKEGGMREVGRGSRGEILQ